MLHIAGRIHPNCPVLNNSIMADMPVPHFQIWSLPLDNELHNTHKIDEKLKTISKWLK